MADFAIRINGEPIRVNLGPSAEIAERAAARAEAAAALFGEIRLNTAAPSDQTNFYRFPLNQSLAAGTTFLIFYRLTPGVAEGYLTMVNTVPATTGQRHYLRGDGRMHQLRLTVPTGETVNQLNFYYDSDADILDDFFLLVIPEVLDRDSGTLGRLAGLLASTVLPTQETTRYVGPIEATGVFASYDAGDIPFGGKVRGSALAEWPNQIATGKPLKRFLTNKMPRYIDEQAVRFSGGQYLQYGHGSLEWTLRDMKRLGRAGTSSEPIISSPDGHWSATGLTRDSEGNWIVGHDGRTGLSDFSYDPYLVIYNQDFTQIVEEIDLSAAPYSITNNTVQGVDYDAANDAIWIADRDNSRLMRIPRDQSTPAVQVEITGLAGVVNGVAFDPVENVLYYSITGDNLIRVIAPTASGAPTTIRTINVASGINQIHFANGLLYVNILSGVNPSDVQVFDPVDCHLLGAYQALLHANSLEGIYIDDDGSLVGIHNGGYHSDAPYPYSAALRYDIEQMGVATGASLLITAVLHRERLGSGSSDLVLVHSGNPYAASSAGWSLAIESATDDLVFVASDRTAARAEKKWPVGLLSGDQVIRLEWTPGTNTCDLYANGLLISPSSTTGSFATAYGSTVRTPALFLGGVKVNSSDTVVSAVNDIQVKAIALANSLTDKVKIEGALAWRHRIRLPGGHTYASAPPVIA